MHPEPDTPRPGRYADYETDDGDVVLDDTENDDAWIASSISERVTSKF